MRSTVLALSWAAAAALAALPLLTRAAETVEIAISDYRFQPAELTIKVGTTVRWVNNEKRTSHSILFTGEGGSESERFFPGESWQRTFDNPGVYIYTCGPHPEMSGRIEVTE